MSILQKNENKNYLSKIMFLSKFTFYKIFFINKSNSFNPKIYHYMPDFDYSTCLFEARLQKASLLRRKEDFYLYFSTEKIIINRVPYSKQPDIVLQLLPTTHVKWLWETKDKKTSLKGFIIETEGYLNEFIAEKVVLQMLKMRFKQITLQSDFYDEYVLGKYLDKGNYAQVYECTRKDNNQRHAVKILQKQRLKTIKNGKQSVFNELKILRNLHHKNLMCLFQVFQDRNKYYFVLELLEGITLYKEIQNRKKKKEFKPHQIRGVVKQLLEGVKYMNDRNIMHRDIKPENILFESKEALQRGDASEGLKIVDYGLATFQHEENVIFTKCGTPGFVAPQIITYDEKQPIYKVNVDVFSVGVILHILLVGQQSFPGRSRNTILNKNKQCKIDFKSKKYEAIASDGIDLLSKLLEKNPQKRISPGQALNHPFLVKDRPIFKFKKVFSEQKENLYENFQMKMYKNLEEIALEDQKKNQSIIMKEGQIPESTNRGKLALKYIDELTYYDPFSHEITNPQAQFDQTTMINSKKPRRQKRKVVRTICPSNQPSQTKPLNTKQKEKPRIRKASDGSEYIFPGIEAFQNTQNFFSYEKSRPS